MPDKPITIKITREFRSKENNTVWPVKTQLTTTQAELKERNVPRDSYEIVGDENLPTDAPGPARINAALTTATDNKGDK